MELVSNEKRSSLDGPIHGSFSKFLVDGRAHRITLTVWKFRQPAIQKFERQNRSQILSRYGQKCLTHS